MDVCEDTKEKLGRQLQENERDFLQWMYNHYQNEEREKRSQNVYTEVEREKEVQC